VLESERSDLQGQVDKLKAKLREVLDKLKSSQAEHQSTKQALESELSTSSRLREELSSSQSSLSKLESELSKMESELGSSLSRGESLEEELRQLRNKLSESERAFEEAKGQWTLQIEVLIREKSELTIYLQEASEKLSSTHDAFTALQNSRVVASVGSVIQEAGRRPVKTAPPASSSFSRRSAQQDPLQLSSTSSPDNRRFEQQDIELDALRAELEKLRSDLRAERDRSELL